MRKALAVVLAGAFTGALLTGVGPASAADCRLVQSEIDVSTLSYVQGLEGCAGEVYEELQGAWQQGGPFEEVMKGYTQYDNETATTWITPGNSPCWIRMYAKYGDQEIVTQPVFNEGCNPPS